MHSTIQHCFPSLFLLEEKPCGRERVLFLCKAEHIFFGLVYGDSWSNLCPQTQPPYPEMELADMISVSENKHNQYKHTEAIILTIWLNKSLWPLRWRQSSFQPWNVLDPVLFLFCFLVPLQYSISIYCTMASSSLELTPAALMQSWLSKDQFICHRKRFMNILSTHRACCFWSFGPIFIFCRLKHRQLDLSFDLSNCYKLIFG